MILVEREEVIEVWCAGDSLSSSDVFAAVPGGASACLTHGGTRYHGLHMHHRSLPIHCGLLLDLEACMRMSGFYFSYAGYIIGDRSCIHYKISQLLKGHPPRSKDAHILTSPAILIPYVETLSCRNLHCDPRI